jgi:hypothetical protein
MRVKVVTLPAGNANSNLTHTMSLTEIAAALTEAGCTVSIWQDRRVYVRSTPCGGRGDYGYCVSADDVRDITDGITRRSGEICSILSATVAA